MILGSPWDLFIRSRVVKEVDLSFGPPPSPPCGPVVFQYSGIYSLNTIYSTACIGDRREKIVSGSVVLRGRRKDVRLFIGSSSDINVSLVPPTVTRCPGYSSSLLHTGISLTDTPLSYVYVKEKGPTTRTRPKSGSSS